MWMHFAETVNLSVNDAAPSASSTNCSKYGPSHGSVGLFGGHPFNTPRLIIQINCCVNSLLETQKPEQKAE